MAAEGMQFPWRWESGLNSTNLDGIWGMSVKAQIPENPWNLRFEESQVAPQ
jgi:hypothetical protein